MRRLTKAKRDAWRQSSEGIAGGGFINHVEQVQAVVIIDLLDDLDAADEELDEFKRHYNESMIERHEVIAELTKENDRLRAALEDFANYGGRFDPNPTTRIYVNPTQNDVLETIDFFYAYLESIDQHIRARAKLTLERGDSSGR